jgi:hypothetical protein
MVSIKPSFFFFMGGGGGFGVYYLCVFVYRNDYPDIKNITCALEK